jgi:hypothetical protein
LAASAEFSSGQPGDGLIYISPDAGATWTPAKAPTNNWTSVASSADGSRLVAAAAPFWDPASSNYVIHGAVFCSSDAGATWTQTIAPNTNYWSGVASSADGTTLVAASQDVGIYRSLDAGATWTAMSAFRYFGATLACSADGYRLVAVGPWDHICTWPYSGPWRLVKAPPDAYWGPVVCSADGTKLVVIGYGFAYRSGDSGATWTQTSAPTDIACVASSADGTKLAAATTSSSQYPPYTTGAIYRSSNAGVYWTQTSAPSDNWTSVAASADGTNLVASAAPLWNGTNYLGGEAAIYRSSNAGATWIRTSAPSNVWHSVALSGDGTNLVAGGEPAVYRSSDAGATWIPTSLPSGYWNSVASSADGTKLVAVSGDFWDPAASNYVGGAIYHSSDAGATWVRTTAPTGDWSKIASSADGTILCALGDEPEISTNSGASWAPAGVPAGYWNAVAASSDGSFLVVAGYGQIATLHAPAPASPVPPSPQLAIDRPGANLELSWLVPSTPFVLEQNSDLNAADWVAVPTTPSLNFTNLHYQLTLPPTPGNAFYRLKLQ